MPVWVAWFCFMQNKAHTISASKHYSSVSCFEMLLVCLSPFLPPYAFLGALEGATGLPCKMLSLPPSTMVLVSLCTQHEGRALMCHLMDAGLFGTTGRSSSGSNQGERHAEASWGGLTRESDSFAGGRENSNRGPNPLMFFYNSCVFVLLLLHLQHLLKSNLEIRLNQILPSKWICTNLCNNEH